MAAQPLVLVSGKDVLDGVGGHETYVRAHAQAAAGLGFAPHVFCVGRRARVTETSYGTVHHVAPALPVAAQVPLLGRAIARRMRDPVAVHGFAIWSGAAVLAARRLGCRSVASAYGTRAYEVGAMQPGLRAHHGRRQRIRHRAWLGWIRAVDDPLEGWGYRNADAVLVNYASVARLLGDAYGVASDTVPYAAPVAALPRPARSGPPLVLAVSRHDPRKGLDVLLHALARLEIPFRACLIGPGRLLGAHRRLAAELGLSDRVAIPGRVEDVAPHLAAADVFVLPSLAEASGSVSVIEALAAGTAVIASACDGIPEDLTDGVDARLVVPGDAAALAGAIGALVGDPGLRERLARAGRVTYERRFSPAGLAAALEAVYGRL